MSVSTTTKYDYIYDRTRPFKRIDISADDKALLDSDIDQEGVSSGTENPETLLQNEGYSPDFSDFSSPIVDRDRDITTFPKIDPNDITMLGGGDSATDVSLMADDDDANKHHSKYIPSAVVDYYNEAALKSKDRNAIPDEDFGIPRLRAYPLHDKAHVKQAIRMFGHCRDPKDREVLAGNIFKAVEKHKVSVKIGKKNPLYKYAPESLKEDTEIPSFLATVIGTPLDKRTKEDIRKEHLRVNSDYYNNVFYGTEFSKAAKAAEDFDFLEFFYPDVRRMSFPVRLEAVCGGLASSSSREELYKVLGIRNPLSTDFTVPLGWCSTDNATEDYSIFANANYTDTMNWFGVDLGADMDHIFFCLRLYSIMGEIFLDPNFTPNLLTDKHYALLMDWNQRVAYHYDLYLDAEPDSDEMLREIQYLFDLFWTFTDNPNSEEDISVNVIEILRAMPSVQDIAVNMNESNDSGELITKEKCSSYLVHDLGMPDDIYLLPASLEYPVVSKESVKLAMDMIGQISPESRQEYVTNLNRKYREFGCTFSISIDHPYAKYADKAIIANMTHMLLEGDTVVDDQSDTAPGRVNPEEEPWYKRLDYVRGPTVNLLDNKELGPNKKKQQEPDYTQHDSVL